ncbi:MAG: translesion DNA synthesis-associated protein ImuA [Burkholderiales bacterium]|nr:translesion DNA synthesis-associated protein ImuA [Burkholderiales bacterium]
MPGHPTLAAEAIHPALWRASQLARGCGAYVDSGYPALAAELPGGGWPLGQLTEILIPQAGSAELRLLGPAFPHLENRPVLLLTPPYTPQALAFSAAGLAPAQLLWVRCSKHADALWAAEQILRNGSCGALLFWQSQLRSEALRRLHLAAQGTATLLCLIRSLQCASLPSPAPLRISLQAAAQGLQLQILKRRGAPLAKPLLLRLPAHPYLFPYAEPEFGRATAAAGLPVASRSFAPAPA